MFSAHELVLLWSRATEVTLTGDMQTADHDPGGVL